MENNTSNGVDLDLDALEPKGGEINYKGKTIQVTPLTIAQYASLVSISSEIMAGEKSNDANAVIAPLEKLKTLIDEVVPEFAEHNLNPQQLLAVYQLLVKMSSPEDKAVEELKKQGVELKQEGTDDPKASTSSEQ